MNLAPVLDAAVKKHQAGQLLEAEQLYCQILQAEPRHADALHLLGVIAYQAGRHELAIEYIRSALRERGNFAEAECHLGAAQQALGQVDEAVASYRRAVHLKPDYAEAHNNLGTALRLQGKYQEAAASLQQALRLRPDYVLGLNNLGLALQNLGRLDEAAACVQKALRLKPDFAVAHFNLGEILTSQKKLPEAAACYAEAVRLNPSYVEAHNNLGNVLVNQGKFAEAQVSYEAALRFRPDYPTARCNLGLVLRELGDFTAAEQAYRVVLRDHPRYDDALSQLATLLRGDLPAADRTAIEQRLADPALKDVDRCNLLFGLGQVCDARGEYEQAAILLRQANALELAQRRQNGESYDLEENARFIATTMAVFTPAFFEQMRGFGLDSERPVFIVGLPRSATTLTEQILAAHSQVYGAGELWLARDDFMALATEQTSLTGGPEQQGQAVRRQAQKHLDQLWALNSTAARVVDKMPENYLYLGVLAALFPRAKFIHCRRDLRDVAVSCWMTHFLNLRWANDPVHILARFREYQRLMDHWRAVLPVPVLEINYEETVADLPGTARRLVEWCGLDWEPACLDFHKVKKPVRTASVIQVRQSLHTRSVARWRNYEQELGTLFAALSP